MKLWFLDSEIDPRWPLYSRGNVGEVMPHVARPCGFELYGPGVDAASRRAMTKFGLLRPGDVTRPMTCVALFGGYLYLNASLMRLMAVRLPGIDVGMIDQQVLGDSPAPPYVRRRGDRNLVATGKLLVSAVRLTRATALPELDDDRRRVAEFVARRPPDDATDDALVDYCQSFRPLFEDLFERHLFISSAGALGTGPLEQLCTKAGRPEALVSILAGLGEVESAAPSVAMWDLAVAARAVPTVDAAFDAGVDGLLDRLADDPAAAPWLADLATFLDRFGSRGPLEMDLAADTWALDPRPALAAIGRMRHADPTHEPRRQLQRLGAARDAADAEVRAALNPLQRKLFDRARRTATLYLRGRERTKATLVRAVHEVRLVHCVLAARLAARGGPAERDRTALLTLGELRGTLRDPASVAGLIDERAAQLARLSAVEPPFVIDGVVPPLEQWSPRRTAAEPAAPGSVLRGIAGSPGVARGRARIVLHPGDPGDLGPGDVLVAPLTDASWTPLFVAAEAVVVDVGALMSHSVIVSRELGIPCVVSVAGATTTIRDGTEIEVDGNRGTVTVVD